VGRVAFARQETRVLGSQAADQAGSRNLIGIKNPAVDELIKRVIFAKDARAGGATKALDRVLLWNHYVVPQWTYGKQRTARWDRFARPEKLPQSRRPPSRPSGGGMPSAPPRRDRDSGCYTP